jgi:Protein of unknown function (DUF1553)/Protein of unknown function (DUF1549)/PA14 domain
MSRWPPIPIGIPCNRQTAPKQFLKIEYAELAVKRERATDSKRRFDQRSVPCSTGGLQRLQYYHCPRRCSLEHYLPFQRGAGFMASSLLSLCSSLFLLLVFADTRTPPAVEVEILEGIPDKQAWDYGKPKVSETYSEPAFGMAVVPGKFSPQGIILDRSNPFVLRATGSVTLPAGEHRFLLRSHGAARLWIDDRVVLETAFVTPNADGHESVPEAPSAPEEGEAPLPVGHQEMKATIRLEAGLHKIRLECFIGGKRLRPELGDLAVAVAKSGEPFYLLGPGPKLAFTEEAWSAFAASAKARHQTRDAVARKAAQADEFRYWEKRHAIARQEWKNHNAGPKPAGNSSIDDFVDRWLASAGVTPTLTTGDAAFLRRVTLDAIGVIPTRAEIAAFHADTRPDRRARAIARLLADSRWADNWVGYWQDVLAENPGILKPTLNNTGPFRWWIHQAFLDNMPMDRFVTELIMMQGSKMGGGPAGFGMATQNDAPMAAKADIVAKAFLGVELQCARCHDAPRHPFKQKDLFSLAAMIGNSPQTVPITSTVTMEGRTRRPRVEVTLAPGAKIDPAWPFPELAPTELPDGIVRDPKNLRERFAAILTSPRNERFALVMVNRLWKRLMGWGLVEPVDDWQNAEPAHPELLSYLADEFVTHGYDLRHVARLIFESSAYQRCVPTAAESSKTMDATIHGSPTRRRLTAEQLVDSLFLAAGKEFGAEELTMDPEGRRPATEMINLGRPRRAWEFTSLSNERDRPALALPVAQSILDLLTAYGWRDSRQSPITVRDEIATPLQPLVLANGVVGTRISRLSDDSAFTRLALEDRTLPDLVQAVFLQILSRPPSAAEHKTFVELLQEGYSDRRLTDATQPPTRRSTATAVSWSNHLSPEATKIKLELERLAREGDPPTTRLRGAWRERMEDMIWALINSPEFVFTP